ncbi:unnamed protein product [Symbiodinium sp. CCMP2592]|nr:unnamed protein product [Symbiodinium sp. CCMP2592]
MVTAYVQKRQTVLVPSQPFIDNYLFIVPEIKDLAGYNISIEDVQATLEWLRTLEALELNSLAHPKAVDDVVGKLTATAGDGTVAAATDVTECVIVADPDNMEAMATAYVLFEMLSPLMIKVFRYVMLPMRLRPAAVQRNPVDALPQKHRHGLLAKPCPDPCKHGSQQLTAARTWEKSGDPEQCKQGSMTVAVIAGVD